jgi:hypothetical protein
MPSWGFTCVSCVKHKHIIITLSNQFPGSGWADTQPSIFKDTKRTKDDKFELPDNFLLCIIFDGLQFKWSQNFNDMELLGLLKVIIKVKKYDCFLC